ncbi:MAG TPA: hypothetical protein VGO11_02585 [Chthoniobacteraceae bacterium]|jgi:hypothetical protein|nr:hypothetical protein [Chthoniobacteraceae bacterium]
MKRRSLSISYCSVVFGAFGLLFLAAAALQTTYLIGGKFGNPLVLGLSLLLAGSLMTTAAGLWRLLPWSRLTACWISGLGFVAAALRIYTPRLPEYATYGPAEWFGFALSALMFAFLFLSPLYFLTRPHNAAAFQPS